MNEFTEWTLNSLLQVYFLVSFLMLGIISYASISHSIICQMNDFGQKQLIKKLNITILKYNEKTDNLD